MKDWFKTLFLYVKELEEYKTSDELVSFIKQWEADIKKIEELEVDIEMIIRGGHLYTMWLKLWKEKANDSRTYRGSERAIGNRGEDKVLARECRE